MDHEPEDLGERQQASAVPVVAALVVVAVAAVAGYLFLRPDDSGELVRPERLEVLDDRTIRAEDVLPDPCHRVRRAQVDMDRDAVFVELVVDDGVGEDEGCVTVEQPVEAEITLPEPVGGRELRAGVGRFPLPCELVGSDRGTERYRCGPGR